MANNNTVSLEWSDHTLPPEILVSSFKFDIWALFWNSMPSLVHDTFGVFDPQIPSTPPPIKGWSDHTLPPEILVSFFHIWMTAHQNLGIILLVS